MLGDPVGRTGSWPRKSRSWVAVMQRLCQSVRRRKNGDLGIQYPRGIPGANRATIHRQTEIAELGHDHRNLQWIVVVVGRHQDAASQQKCERSREAGTPRRGILPQRWRLCAFALLLSIIVTQQVTCRTAAHSVTVALPLTPSRTAASRQLAVTCGRGDCAETRPVTADLCGTTSA